jgi:hypothetical protein
MQCFFYDLFNNSGKYTPGRVEILTDVNIMFNPLQYYNGKTGKMLSKG